MDDIIQQINKASLKLLESVTLDDTYKKIAHEAVHLVKGDEGRIILKKGKELEVVYATIPHKKGYKSRKEGSTWESYKNRKAFVIHERTFGKMYPSDVKEGIKSIIFIPLHFKRQSFGVLLIKSKELQEFTDRELKILKLFGAIASLTLRKTQLLSETRKNLELKDKFLALAAHELRTPITSMSGYIQLLHRKLQNSSVVEGDWIESLLQESKRLTTLIEEILEINKMNAGKLTYDFQECSIDSLLKEAIKIIEITYPHRKIVVPNKLPSLQVIGDKLKLIKAFYNILENAVKYSEKNVQIKITKNKSFVEIAISDLGKGISEEDLPYIFEGFFKGKGNVEEGMGLGLFYAKNVIQSHKGKIKITSKVDKGTLVEMQLPLAEYE